MVPIAGPTCLRLPLLPALQYVPQIAACLNAPLHPQRDVTRAPVVVQQAECRGPSLTLQSSPLLQNPEPPTI